MLLQVTYPDYYSNACCSHPLFINNEPEDVVTAARRKLNHELGIPLDQVDTNLHYIFLFNPMKSLSSGTTDEC